MLKFGFTRQRFCYFCSASLKQPLKKDSSIQFLCDFCTRDFASLRYQEKNLLHSHIHTFKYEGSIRELVLRAKVQNCQKSLAVILLLFNDAILSNAAALANCQIVYPMHSSLWGRLRGKTDIAYFLAMTLSRKFELTLKNPPLALGWHLSKHAKKRKKDIIGEPKKNKFSASAQIIIVDDIFTTGSSLNQFCSYLNTKQPINLITFAKANHPG